MRLNLPVSNTEYAFPAGETLASTTDPKGRILYCNPAFIAVSGYTKEELLGQPHNLIRHPDMPEEAYRDMWETIASGRPWSAAVKNRRKDGSFHWVMANVTPLMQGDASVGYMSVRTEPSREVVQAATALYATMHAEKEAGQRVHRLQAGLLRIDTVAGRLRRAATLGLQTKLGLVAGLLAGVSGPQVRQSVRPSVAQASRWWQAAPSRPVSSAPGCSGASHSRRCQGCWTSPTAWPRAI